MKHPYLIFDFDGTLVDSFTAIMSKINLIADQFNFPRVEDEQIELLRNMNSRDLMKHFKIPAYKIPAILLGVRKQLRAEVQNLRSFDNLPETLAMLHSMNIRMGIVTSNSSENVTKWLKQYNLTSLFKFIHVESSYFGKKHILKKLIKLHNMDKAKTYYIGDETRDVDAANQSGINSIAVSWGYNSREVLLSHQPKFMVNKAEEILDVFV